VSRGNPPQDHHRASAAALRDGSDVAVIGYAGRFPGAASVAELWRNLASGAESIRRLSPDEVRHAGVPAEVASHPDFVAAEALPAGIELFDAAFFDVGPREAEITDPQHRLLLECAWEALADAGYDPFRFAGAIGVFAGATLNTYLPLQLMAAPELLAGYQPVQINIGNSGDFLTTRISYKLNLRGPSHAVQSACSTSLVAIHLAREKLLGGECDMALAGGVSLNLSLRGGYLFHAGGMASPDGRCRPFDSAGQGTVFGGGAGLVVLRRLADALADGDPVRAVIKGSAVNNDGHLKVGYTAPSVEGQAQVIEEALADAGVSPDTLGYVEAHGTATALGDPIEVEALSRAFRRWTPRRGFCGLGSIKGNLGHLDAAAGVTGLLKIVLALEHGLLPATLHHTRPNPEIDFAASPFFVVDRPLPWPRGEAPRRAAVSAFGVGGTNAHVVLEEAPLSAAAAAAASRPGRSAQLLVLSAHTAPALAAATAALRDHLAAMAAMAPTAAATEQGAPAALADVAWTLQAGRRELGFRRAVVGGDRRQAVAALGSAEEWLDGPVGSAGRRPPAVVFLFPGQGSLAPGATAELYRDEPVFRREMDRACEALAACGIDPRTALYPAAGRQAAAADALEHTSVAQPALVAVELALARLWSSWGVRPRALAGHSLGELTAACLAGALSPAAAVMLAAERGRLMEELPAGAMLSVPLGEEDLAPWLGGGAGRELDLAAVNAPGRSVVSGPPGAIAQLERELAAQGVASRRLRVTRAFHSRALEPMAAAFAERLRTAGLRPPELPWLSNLTGTWVTPRQATDPRYWTEQLLRPVRFADNLAELLADEGVATLEVGPGRTLTHLVRQHPACGAGRLAVASLPEPPAADAPATRCQTAAGRRRDGIGMAVPDAAPAGEAASLLAALGRLWVHGQSVDWQGVHGGERRRRLPLPGNPFERQRYWVEARRAPQPAAADSPGSAPAWQQEPQPQQGARRCAGEPPEHGCRQGLGNASRPAAALAWAAAPEPAAASDPTAKATSPGQGGPDDRPSPAAGMAASILQSRPACTGASAGPPLPAAPPAGASRPRPELAVPYVAPAGELERRIAAVWQRVLGIDRVGARDNFFELGGDSLVAVQTIDLLQRELLVEMPVTNLYESVTVRDLAGLLAAGAAAAEPAAGEARPGGGTAAPAHDARRLRRDAMRAARRERAAVAAAAEEPR
jgi:phthiocerol/phenolphthiocerol synthesis type-I polyketide synthase E